MPLIEEHTELMTSDGQHVANIYIQPPECDRVQFFNFPTLLVAPKGYLTKFTNFPKLPAELRCIIWSYAFEPRELDLRQGIFNEQKEDRIASFTSNPVTLRVNKESRCETQRHYIQINQKFTLCPFYYMPDFDTAVISFGDRRGNRTDAQAFDIGMGLKLSSDVIQMIYEHLKNRDARGSRGPLTMRSRSMNMRDMFAPATKLRQVKEIK